MWINVKKIGLTLSVIVLFALYALQRQMQPSGGRSLIAAALPAATMAGDPPTASFTVIATSAPPALSPSLAQKELADVGAARTSSTAVPNAATATARKASATAVTASATRAPVRASAPTPTPGHGYKDGTYTGVQTDAYWGTVQVQAVIASGQLTDVHVLGLSQPPEPLPWRSTNRPCRWLIQEAIQSQNANVDIVTGRD